jgi:hypothetical protein
MCLYFWWLFNDAFNSDTRSIGVGRYDKLDIILKEVVVVL